LSERSALLFMFFNDWRTWTGTHCVSGGNLYVQLAVDLLNHIPGPASPTYIM
jgi:hypothetical protein